jgi:hypothetical protein
MLVSTVFKRKIARLLKGLSYAWNWNKRYEWSVEAYEKYAEGPYNMRRIGWKQYIKRVEWIYRAAHLNKE